MALQTRQPTGAAGWPSELPDRITRRLVIDENGCWLWTGYTDPRGYGRCNRIDAPGRALVHRVVYEALVGTIADGLVLDHLSTGNVVYCKACRRAARRSAA